MIKISDNKIDYLLDERVVGNVFFTKDNNLIRLTSTIVRPEERGKGTASKMLEEVFNYFRKNNYKVIIECSYVNKWILDKKDYQDLIVK